MTDQKRLRIQLSVYALAYERYQHSFVSDAKYDEMSLKVDLSIATDRPDLDEWFKENFSVHTGQWVLDHPEFQRLDVLVQQLIAYCYNRHVDIHGPGVTGEIH